MDAQKRPPGRPPDGEGEDARLEIRLSEARKKAYSAAATRSGQKLAFWIRAALDRASKR